MHKERESIIGDGMGMGMGMGMALAAGAAWTQRRLIYCVGLAGIIHTGVQMRETYMLRSSVRRTIRLFETNRTESQYL